MNEKIETGLFCLAILFLVFAGGILGYSLNSKKDCYEKKYDGLRIASKDYFEAINITKQYDEYGDWVCINAKNMDYERCVEVASHECAHEIWAEICEKNDELCRKGQELLQEYSKNAS